MSFLVFLCLVVAQCSFQTLSLDLLDPALKISGTVWEDWNGDGMRQPYEPGFARATVFLKFEVPEDINFLMDKGVQYDVQPPGYLTDSTGYYYFDCLTQGNYSIQINLPHDRPSTFVSPHAGNNSAIDSDITNFNGSIGSTDFIMDFTGTDLEIDAGVSVYGFFSLFPMTGRENVPTEPDTNLGCVYSVYNALTSTLYYRIERGPWKEYNYEISAGFYQGFPGQNGPQLRSLGDRSAVKTNFWVVPSNISPLFLSGNVNVLIIANGSFSDDGRIRGNWNPFYNRKNVKAHIELLGENIYPTPVTTSAIGTLDVSFNFDSTWLSYGLVLSGFGRAQIQSIGVYGPSGADAVGSYTGLQLMEGNHTVNISGIPNFAQNFFSKQLYVLVKTDEYPNGQVRGQIDGFSQIIYQTSSFYNNTHQVHAALSFDSSKNTLAYYITAPGPQSVTYSYTTFYFPFNLGAVVDSGYWSNGMWIWQGFFWNLDHTIIESDILFGTYLDVQIQAPGFYFTDFLTPTNWY